MDKKTFRKSVLAEIEALPADYIEASNAGIRDNFSALPEFQKAHTIFAYISVGREPDTAGIIKAALDAGKTVALPVSLDGGIMQPRCIHSLSELVPGKFGIPAPPENAPIIDSGEINLIIVPAVTFDRRGFRLGRGGGYYDRFLQGSGAFSVGLGRERLIRPVPLEPHDMSVDCLVTESGVYREK